jgi:hypothetical protein
MDVDSYGTYFSINSFVRTGVWLKLDGTRTRNGWESDLGIRPGGVGFSRKPEDQTKNSCGNSQIETKINFS